MSRIVSALSVVILCLLLLAGCGQASHIGPAQLSYPAEFTFSSGAGAWSTVLTLNEDGSFSGSYGDSEMGSVGKDYPNGTHYHCSFQGQFRFEPALDIHSYPLTRTELTTDLPEGAEEIHNGIRYIATDPHGLEGCTRFILYAPTTPVFGLDEELLSWWPGRFEQTQPETLSCWALWNTEEGFAFFTYPEFLT